MSTIELFALLQDQLKTFMDNTFENIMNTERALCMLKKFERYYVLFTLLEFCQKMEMILWEWWESRK